jgi:hypothetical protein
MAVRPDKDSGGARVHLVLARIHGQRRTQTQALLLAGGRCDDYRASPYLASVSASSRASAPGERVPVLGRPDKSPCAARSQQRFGG